MYALKFSALALCLSWGDVAHMSVQSVNRDWIIVSRDRDRDFPQLCLGETATETFPFLFRRDKDRDSLEALYEVNCPVSAASRLGCLARPRQRLSKALSRRDRDRDKVCLAETSLGETCLGTPTLW